MRVARGASRETAAAGEVTREAARNDLTDRTLHELRLRGYSWRTVRVYAGHVRRFLEWLGGDPGDRPREDAKRYLTHMLAERRVSHSYLTQAVSAIKFLYRYVLELPELELKLPRPRRRRYLPVVMSVEEVARLLGVVRNRKHRAILMVVYSAGLRVGEVVRLKVQDIDSERGLIHVRQGKGHKDRYVMLSDITLSALREYWITERPRRWLFPGARNGRHLHERSVQKVFQSAREKAGIYKRVSVHSLRHAFATHLLEDGIDIRYIQKLLGHKSTKTTEIYTRVSRRALGSIRSPLDRLGERGLLEEAGAEETPNVLDGFEGPDQRQGRRPDRRRRQRPDQQEPAMDIAEGEGRSLTPPSRAPGRADEPRSDRPGRTTERVPGKGPGHPEEWKKWRAAHDGK